MNRISTLIATALLMGGASTSIMAQDGVSFGYCSDNINGHGMDYTVTPYWMGAAMYLDADDVAQFDGGEITSVSIGFGKGRNKQISLFITYDLSQTPFYTQSGRCRASQWNDIPVTNPVKIEAGKPIYVGYTYQAEDSGATPIGFDGQTGSYTDGADWFAASTDSEGALASAWEQVGPRLGNACIRLTVKAKTVQGANCMPTALHLPELAYPGQQFSFTLDFNNASVTSVDNIEVEYQIGDDAVKTATVSFPEAVGSGQNGQATVQALTEQDGISLVTWARITRVNGQDNALADRRISGDLDCTNSFFQRKMLVEKVTGVHCGYCTRGIAGFDMMNQKYPDRFIGVAIQNYDSSDPLRCSYYEPWQNKFSSSGVPYCFVNRNGNLTKNPTTGGLQDAYNKVYQEKYDLGLELAIKQGSDSRHYDVDVTVRSVRGRDNLNYGLVFIVTEDFLGPYWQYNNYNTMDGCPEFYGKGNPVQQMYDDVARFICSDYLGIEGSVPANLEAGRNYVYNMKDLSLGNTSVPMNASIVVAVADLDTDEIVNVERIRIDPDRHTSGVTAAQTVADGRVFCRDGRIVYAATEGQAEAYSLSGRHAATVPAGAAVSVPAGLYIVKTPNGAVKVMVK